jgi:hypothetical protein
MDPDLIHPHGQQKLRKCFTGVVDQPIRAYNPKSRQELETRTLSTHPRNQNTGSALAQQISRQQEYYPPEQPAPVASKPRAPARRRKSSAVSQSSNGSCASANANLDPQLFQQQYVVPNGQHPHVPTSNPRFPRERDLDRTVQKMGDVSPNFDPKINTNIDQQSFQVQQSSQDQHGPQEYRLAAPPQPHLPYEELVASKPLPVPVISFSPTAHLPQGAKAGSPLKPFISLVQSIHSVSEQPEQPQHMMCSTTPTSLHHRLPQHPQNPRMNSTPHYSIPPEAQKTVKPLMNEVLLLHDFIIHLPTESPSPFSEEIFVDTALTYTSERRLKTFNFSEKDANGNVHRYTESGFVPGEPKNYRAHSVVSANHRLVVNSGRVTEGFCTVWTRKFPEGWAGLRLNDRGELDEGPKTPARKRRKISGEDNEEDEAPESEIIWQYSASVTVMKGDRPIKISCPVPKRVVEINGVSYDLEPAWEDIVKALRNKIHNDEVAMGWPQCSHFSNEIHSQPAYNVDLQRAQPVFSEVCTLYPEKDGQLLSELLHDPGKYSNPGQALTLQHNPKLPMSRPASQNSNLRRGILTRTRSQAPSKHPTPQDSNLNPSPQVYHIPQPASQTSSLGHGMVTKVGSQIPQYQPAPQSQYRNYTPQHLDPPPSVSQSPGSRDLLAQHRQSYRDVNRQLHQYQQPVTAARVRYSPATQSIVDRILGQGYQSLRQAVSNQPQQVAQLGHESTESDSGHYGQMHQYQQVAKQPSPQIPQYNQQLPPVKRHSQSLMDRRNFPGAPFQYPLIFHPSQQLSPFQIDQVSPQRSISRAGPKLQASQMAMFGIANPSGGNLGALALDGKLNGEEISGYNVLALYMPNQEVDNIAVKAQLGEIVNPAGGQLPLVLAQLLHEERLKVRMAREAQDVGDAVQAIRVEDFMNKNAYVSSARVPHEGQSMPQIIIRDGKTKRVSPRKRQTAVQSQGPASIITPDGKITRPSMPKKNSVSPKKQTSLSAQSPAASSMTPDGKVKRPRGRPRKNPGPIVDESGGK